jgi:hypothetical protein
MSKKSLSNSEGYRVTLAMLAALILPVIITLATVRTPSPLLPPEQYPTPYGYTWSLTIFSIPIGVIGWWFLYHQRADFHKERRAFWLTIGILAPLGFALDILLGNSFFTFVNANATLQWFGPGYDFQHGWLWNIPVEEFAFYFLGFLAVLLIYIWNDLFWLRAYSVDDRVKEANKIARLYSPHWSALAWGIVLAVSAVFYKKFGPHSYQEGFPGYFVFLTVLGFGPMFVFFRTARPLINWRAFTQTLFPMLLISLMWEGTLGVPFKWWGYQYEQMVGLTAKPWGNLPVEAVLVWLVVTWATVIFYEIIRIALHLKRPWHKMLF